MGDGRPADETSGADWGADPRPNGSPDDEGEAFTSGPPCPCDEAGSPRQPANDADR
jgi:hypothetical protein